MPGTTPQARAREWLAGQADPLLRHTNGGRIDPDGAYGYDHVGPMQGQFTISDPVPETRLVVFAPNPIPANFTGPIRGAVWGQEFNEYYQIEAYLFTDEYYFQGNAVAAGDGTWQFDAVGRAGEWRFRLIDSFTGEPMSGEWRQGINPAHTVEHYDPITPVEVMSPDPIPPAYEGVVTGRTRGAGTVEGAVYRLDAYLVTDTHYLQEQIAVIGGADWSFQAVGRGGEWRFRLIDETGAQVGEEWDQILNHGQAYVAFPSSIPPIVWETPIILGWPDPIPARYSGRITGSVRDFHLDPTRKFAVDAYLYSDTHYLQARLTVDGAGRWAIDAVGRAGEWRFRLIDLASGAQVGNEWRQEISGVARYKDVALRLYSVTDASYLVSEVPARYGGRWSIDATAPGQKLLALVNTVTGYEYARWTHGTGLLRSYAFARDDSAYGTPYEHRGTAYDQAVAVLAFLQAGDVETATRLGTALGRVRHANGALPFSFHQIAWMGGDAYYRSGAVAWGAYALVRLAGALPAPAPGEVVAGARGALDYLLTLQDAETGLVRGGSGRYAADDTFDPAYTVAWFSTEHNIDAWFAFRAAGELFGVPAYTVAAERIRRGLLGRCWDEASGRFWQGLGADGTPDGQGALDVHSWGALLLHAWGMGKPAARALSRADSNYRVVDPASGAVGYKPYSPSEGYPGAAETVWLEGSFGVLLAKLRTGAPGAAELGAGLESLQRSDGSFRYATIRDVRYEISDRRSVASTGWYLLAESGSLLWTEREVTTRRVVATGAPFYADPFGKQDSTRRVQRAVERAAENLKAGGEANSVHLPPGRYRCTATITIPRDVSVTGVEGETILDCSEMASGPALQWGLAAAGSPDGAVTGIRVRTRDGSEGPPSM